MALLCHDLDGTDQPGGVGPLSLLVLGDPKRIADATCNDHQLHPPHLPDFIVPPVPPLGLPKDPPPPPVVPKPNPNVEPSTGWKSKMVAVLVALLPRTHMWCRDLQRPWIAIMMTSSLVSREEWRHHSARTILHKTRSSAGLLTFVRCRSLLPGSIDGPRKCGMGARVLW